VLFILRFLKLLVKAVEKPLFVFNENNIGTLGILAQRTFPTKNKSSFILVPPVRFGQADKCQLPRMPSKGAESPYVILQQMGRIIT